MENIKILFVEDEEIQRDLFNDALELFKASNADYTIDVSIQESINIDVFKSILQWIDFLVVDLRIPNTWDGNDIINIIREANIVPIFVVTGHTGDLTDTNQTEFYKIYDKWDGDSNIYEVVLNDIKNLYDTGFSKVVWRHWKTNMILKSLVWWNWLQNIAKWRTFGDLSKAEQSLSRHILSHLHHQLSGGYENFHPEEIYIKNWTLTYDTGTILKNSSDYYVILTPACDIAQDKPSKPKFTYYKLYKILPLQTDPGEHHSMKLKLSKYVLQWATFFEWGYIDFEDSISVSKSAITDYQIQCLISPLFLKDIVFKIWNYYGRQWSPDIW